MKLPELYSELVELIKQEEPDLYESLVMSKAFDIAIQYAECKYCSNTGGQLMNNQLYCKEH